MKAGKLRHLILTLMVLILGAVWVQAQEPVRYELPAVQDGDTISDTFADTITAHLYGFNASAGDVVTITMAQTNPDLDPLLILLSSEGAVLASDDDSGSVALSAEIANFAIEEDGAYLVMATSVYFVGGAIQELDDDLSYDLTISGMTTPTSVEDADLVLIEAESASANAVFSGELDTDAPLAFFQWALSANDNPEATITSDGFFTSLHLFNGQGERVAIDPSALAVTGIEDEGIYLLVVADEFFYEIDSPDTFFTGGQYQLTIVGQ